MDFQIIGGNPSAKIYIDNRRECGGVLFFDVNMQMESAAVPERFSVLFSMPDVEVYSVWSPSMHADRHIGPNWRKRTTNARLASWMPLQSLISASGRNRMTVSISDAKTPTAVRSGECEEDANVQWEIRFFTIPVAPIKEYRATLRIDTRDIPYYDAIRDAATWWETDCGYTPAYVPEHAKLPMNSLWYSYHQALDVEDIVEECRISKTMGMETVIVDDGWQTDDNTRGYRFCGDWEVAQAKIPDMKNFVDRVHEVGMKIMLWFSVPFMGTEAKSFERFRDMLLDGTGDNKSYFSLDPRYREVREYLVGIYERAVREWGFDGLKLDFIDSFELKGRSLEPDARRDYHSLEDAVDALMTEITAALRRINPEVMIEFRQSYVGPAIRKYGNILRVGDCPNDAIRNRVEIIDLRLTSGDTAVHSDMLMWHRDDSVESAASQLISTLYGVPQVSVKLKELTEDHRKMLEFYLAFWCENRDTLIGGRLLAANPESLYSIVLAERDGQAIFTAYTDTVVDCADYSEVIAINASRHRALILKHADGRAYKVLDCMGNLLAEGRVTGALCEVGVAPCGMVCVEWADSELSSK